MLQGTGSAAVQEVGVARQVHGRTSQTVMFSASLQMEMLRN